MGVLGVKIVSIPTGDPDRSKAFYADVLGFEVLEDQPMGPEMRWVRMAPPGGVTSIALVTWFPSMPPGSTKGLLLEVDDIEAMQAHLTSRGVTMANGVESAPWGRYIQIDDPDGNGIVLQQDHVES